MKPVFFQLVLAVLILQGCANCIRYKESWVNVPTCAVFSGGYCQSMTYNMEKQRVCVEWEQDSNSSKPFGENKASTQSVMDNKMCNSATSSLKSNSETLANIYTKFSKSPGEAAAWGVNINIVLVKSSIRDVNKHCSNRDNEELVKPVEKNIRLYESEISKWKKATGTGK